MPESEKIFSRHRLLRLLPDSKPEKADENSHEIFQQWISKGFPLVVRRPCISEDGKNIYCGLPLPLSQKKQRLSFIIKKESVKGTSPPPLLKECINTAPSEKKKALTNFCIALEDIGFTPRVFGSLAWQLITGMGYLTEKSDIDLILKTGSSREFRKLERTLKTIPENGIKYDIEIALPDGNGFSYKEYLSDANEILLKGNKEVSLISRRSLFNIPG